MSGEILVLAEEGERESGSWLARGRREKLSAKQLCTFRAALFALAEDDVEDMDTTRVKDGEI